MPGFGRSDKPTDFDWYSYDRHVAALAPLLEELDVRDATAVVHDWGGPVGLRLAVEHPDRIAKLVVLDTGLFTGHQKMTDAWIAFRDFVARTDDLPVGFLVRGACKQDPGDEVIAAYEAPYPSPESKAGARAFPLILPTAPDAPGAQAGQKVLEALKQDTRRKLILWADSDPVLPLKTGQRFAAALGTDVDHVIEDASHFLQEDQGPRIGALIADWLSSAG
jgi:haloalkane dehalogenase